MKSNKRQKVDRDPDLGSQPATSPFRGVIISGLLLGLIFIIYLFWNANQARKQENLEKEKQRIELENERIRLEKVAAEKKRAEQKAFIASNLEKSRVALKETRWDDAEQSAIAILKLDSDHEAAKALLVDIKREKRDLDVIRAKTAIIKSLGKDDIKTAEQNLAAIKSLDPQNSEISSLTKRITIEKKRILARQKEANKFYSEALALDKGVYSDKAIDLLNKAKKLHPQSIQITELLTKMSGYNSVIKVPADHPTINAALNAARAGDLINVSAGVYKESLLIGQPIRIKGALGGKTIIECAGSESSVITIGADAQGTTLNGLVLKHKGFDYNLERYSGITCQAKGVVINACTIERSIGHGIAVIDGASAVISFCKIVNSGWDGISVYGEGSLANIKETLCENSFQHGIQFWKGGSGSITKSYTLKNNFCGISLSDLDTKVKIQSTVSSDNREAGILISNGATAEMTSNSCKENLNSGIVARGSKTVISMTGNQTTKNQEAGIMIHRVVKVTKFDQNISKDNVTHQIAKDK